jgi:uncharacterized protein
MPDELVPADPQFPSQEPSSAPPPQPSALNEIFLGPNGIRAGWRLLIFCAVFIVVAFVFQAILKRIPYVHNHFGPAAASAEMTPGFAMFSEGLSLAILLAAVVVMSLIEKKSLGDYGLPGREFFGKKFWLGVPYGFGMLSLLLVGIAAFHGINLGSISLTTPAAFHYGVLWAIVFIFVALFEEFSFRGYLQATLGSGIGFWPAAVLLSIAFGAIHLGNSGEAIFGAVMAGTFGLVAAFALQRTRNLWFPIGLHASWDWAETYFYGTPDSGMLAKGHLFSASFHGANWVTGGSVGPEGSYLVLPVLALGAIGIHFLFPAKQNP